MTDIMALLSLIGEFYISLGRRVIVFGVIVLLKDFLEALFCMVNPLPMIVLSLSCCGRRNFSRRLSSLCGKSFSEELILQIDLRGSYPSSYGLSVVSYV